MSPVALMLILRLLPVPPPEPEWIPIYSQHVEYATVLDSSANSILLARRNKFFVTHDGGKTWQPHSELEPDYLVRQIIAFDKCGQKLLVNALTGQDSRGIYITDDAGVTWRKVLDAPGRGEAMYFPSDTSSILC